MQKLTRRRPGGPARGLLRPGQDRSRRQGGAARTGARPWTSDDEFMQMAAVWASLKISPKDAELQKQAVPHLITGPEGRAGARALWNVPDLLGELGRRGQAGHVPALQEALQDETRRRARPRPPRRWNYCRSDRALRRLPVSQRRPIHRDGPAEARAVASSGPVPSSSSRRSEALRVRSRGRHRFRGQRAGIEVLGSSPANCWSTGPRLITRGRVTP